VTTIREWLEADHGAMGALLERADAGGRFDADAFEALRARLLRHIGIEEKILLAAVRDRLGEPISRARRIRVEHGAIASLLVPTPDVALVGELRALLHEHDALEEGEDGVYAECERILGPTALDLVAAAEAFPAVPVARHADGPHTVRTAAAALRGALRMRPPGAGPKRPP
jgi:hypothetical protein